MLTLPTPHSHERALHRLRDADPAATLELSDARAHLILARALAHLDEAPQQRRPSTNRKARCALAIAVILAAVLVPTAVGFHRQILEAFATDDTPASIYDLRGPWTTTLTGLTPARLNGTWTIAFTDIRNRYGFSGNYALTHNRRPVADGTLAFNYTSIGPMINIKDTNGPNQCTETAVGGNYTVQLQRKTITFTPVQDSCQKRRTVLTAHSFRHR